MNKTWVYKIGSSSKLLPIVLSCVTLFGCSFYVACSYLISTFLPLMM